MPEDPNIQKNVRTTRIYVVVGAYTLFTICWIFIGLFTTGCVYGDGNGGIYPLMIVSALAGVFWGFHAKSKASRVPLIILFIIATSFWTLAPDGWWAVPPPKRDDGVMVLNPYMQGGAWVFDDAAVGLRQEPFVEGAPEVIDEIAQGIPDAYKGFRLLFSVNPFPGHTHSLTWQKGDRTGNWYVCDQTQQEAWLCPALFKYFNKAPKKLYAKAEKLSGS